MDARGSQPGEESQGTESSAPKSGVASCTTALGRASCGKGQPASFSAPCSGAFAVLRRVWGLGSTGC